MQVNRVKRIMNAGGMALGIQAGSFADPQVVEIIGLAGFDAARIDLEHTALSLETVQLMIMAAEKTGITPIVRTPGFDPAFILRLLDIGAQGIQVPHIAGAEQAREAVRAVRYAPLGERGMATATRPAEYGRIPLEQHMIDSNREVLLSVMIEDVKAFDEIEEIASIEGIDLISIGPSDLSRALGLGAAKEHPLLIEKVDQIAEAVRRGGHAKLQFPLNNPVYPRNLAQLKDLGVGYMNCAPNPDARLMRVLADEVVKLRAELATL